MIVSSFRSGAPQAVFPLGISADQRSFVTATGKPFFGLLDAAWELPVQCNQAQIDQYLNDRAGRGFTFIIVEATTLLYSSQQPTYLNQAGQSPFATITAQGSSPFGASACDFSTASGQPYYQNLTYLVNGAKIRNMAVILFPAYTGFPATPRQGWYDCIIGDTTAHLQTFGAFMATLLPKAQYGNVIWSASGDNTLSAADLAQHWFIIRGITSVDPTALVYAKAQRHTSGWSMLTADGGLSSFPGLTVNNAYISNCAANGYTQVSDTLAEYARAPIMPVIVDENDYEGNGSTTANDMRLAAWGPLLSGAAVTGGGNEQLWGYGCANNLIANGPAATLASSMNTTYAQHMSVLAQIINGGGLWQGAFIPKTDTSLVTTALGTAASTISPAWTASGVGTKAVIYTASGSGFTVNLAAFNAASVPAVWRDPTTVTAQAASGSPFANTGTHAFTTPGANAAGDNDWALVLG